MRQFLSLFVWLATAIITPAHAAPAEALPLAAAERAAAAALAHARGLGAPGAAVAIVDSGGQLVLLRRLDGTFPAGAEISTGKARTAALFRRPTRVLEDSINKGRPALLTVAASHAFTPLQGGVPLVQGGIVIGGIGVSGAASAQQDEEIAAAGAEALGRDAEQHPVVLVPAADVDAAYAQGDTGAQLFARSEFRVNASRRDGPGQAEVHEFDTDVFHVTSGSAEIVVGGDLVEPRRVAAGELRGLAVRGGELHQLNPGDVMTIPHGVPHWFRRVQPPFRYFVLKSLTGAQP